MTSIPFYRWPALIGVVLAIASIGLAPMGCANTSNALKSSFRSGLERWPSGEAKRLLPPDGQVAILSSNDIERDALRMMESGYLPLGHSTFRGEQVDPEDARQAAADVGASTILLESKYVKTVREAIPVETWVGSQRERPSKASSGADPGARARVGPALRGEIRTTYRWRSVSEYDHAATFWGKSRPPIFGVLVESATAQTTEADPSGRSLGARGVVVRAVLVGSPAARIGVRRDDVIVRFAGVEISNPDQFFDAVVANRAREVEVELVRVAESKVLSHRVTLWDDR